MLLFQYVITTVIDQGSVVPGSSLVEIAASFICQFTLFGASTLFFGNHSPKSVKYFWGDMKDAEIALEKPVI